MNENCQEWYNTISKEKVGELHFGMQDEEYLSFSKNNLEEHFENELNL